MKCQRRKSCAGYKNAKGVNAGVKLASPFQKSEFLSRVPIASQIILQFLISFRNSSGKIYRKIEFEK